MTTKNKQFQPVRTFVIIAGLLALGVLGYLAYKEITKEATMVTPIASGAGSANADVIKEASDETPIVANAVSTYKVAADEPRILRINSLSISARVRPMGVNSAGAIAAPVNIYDSGWYTGSAKPGASGATFIDGHASGATRKGLFAYLDTLKNGNEVSIERGDGQVLTYKVVHVETVPKELVDMQKVLRTYGNATEGLNLMTCTGTWIKDERTYDKRAIVYTERVSS
jgi:LPXTG-site transpeptidase (sortase) family protein